MTRKPGLSHLLLLPLLCALAMPAWADDDDDDDDDHRRRYHKHHGHKHKHKYKEEFWDGNCKVERKWKRDEYKEERKCRTARAYVPPPARPVAVYPARPMVVQPAPVIVHPAPVIVQPAAVPAPPPVVVYPPWVVSEQGRPAYRTGQAPEPVRTRGVMHCQSERVGQVLGGVAGAALGSQVGKGSGRVAATIGGAVAGVLVGGSVGRSIDAADHACIGRALEFAPVGQRVEWAGAGAGRYVLVPGRVQRRGDTYCREFDAEVLTEHGWEQAHGVACRQPDGVWVASH